MKNGTRANKKYIDFKKDGKDVTIRTGLCFFSESRLKVRCASRSFKECVFANQSLEFQECLTFRAKILVFSLPASPLLM